MTCKDCIHRELCADYVSSLAKVQNADVKYISQWLDEIEGKKNQTDNECEHFADRSLFVELPCKVGDTVYFVFEPSDGEVRIDPVKVCNYTIKTDKIKIHTSMGYFTETNLNKDVFLTREEAEQALKERESNE